MRPRPARKPGVPPRMPPGIPVGEIRHFEVGQATWGTYPLVNIQKTMDKSIISDGKINYFDWAIFNSYCYILPEGKSHSYPIEPLQIPLNAYFPLRKLQQSLPEATNKSCEWFTSKWKRWIYRRYQCLKNWGQILGGSWPWFPVDSPSWSIPPNGNMALGRNLVSSAYQSLRQVCVEKYDQPSTWE